MNLSKIAAVTAGKVKTTGVSDFMELELNSIYPNPNQPRKSFENIDELAQSIDKKGLIQAIAVSKDSNGKYMIISGERRFRACTHLGLKTIKCHIINADNKDIEEISLIENIQRNDLTDFEVSNFITRLWESGEYSKKQDLAEVLGKKPAYISKALGLVDKLDESIKEDLKENKSDIGMSVLEEVSRVEDKEIQKEVYEKVKNKEITRAEIKDFKTPKKKESRYEAIKSTFSLEITEKETGKLYQYDELQAFNIDGAFYKAKEKYPVDAENDDLEFMVTDLSMVEKLQKKESRYEDGVFEVEETTIKYPKLTVKDINATDWTIHSKNEATPYSPASTTYRHIETGQLVRKEETFPGETSINKKVAYGFGTVNDIGTYVAVVDGDFKGTFTFEDGGEFMKTTNNREYKITIEYVGDKTQKKDKEKILIHENKTNIDNFLEENK